MTEELYLDTVGEIARKLYIDSYGAEYRLSIADAFELAERFMEVAVELGHAGPLFDGDDDRG